MNSLRLPALALLAAVLACAAEPQPAGRTPPAGQQPPSTAAAVPGPAAAHLTVRGTGFYRADGTPFQWRGISAFRLLEQIAGGNSADAEAFVAWAAERRLTVLRVLSMAHHLFALSPEQGRRSLPRLLEMAAGRGIYVEIVALADTDAVAVDVETHVRAIGEIAARYSNALVEIANEPGHPTQRVEIRRPDRVRALAALLPESVPVALGSVEYGDDFAGGDYVTTHTPRAPGSDGWEHVRSLTSGAALMDRVGKPVVSDEPIGAAADYVAGRRDNEPARFRAAALLTRLAGMGATFHYEGGLHARIPSGIELACFDAWNEAWDVLPAGVEQQGRFSVAETPEGTAYRRLAAREGWLLRLRPGSHPGAPPAGWRVTDTKQFDGVSLIRLER